MKNSRKKFFFWNFSFYASIIILIVFVIFCLFWPKFIFRIYLHLSQHKMKFFCQKPKMTKKNTNLKIMKILNFSLFFAQTMNFKMQFSAGNRQSFAENFLASSSDPKVLRKIFLWERNKNWQFYHPKTTSRVKKAEKTQIFAISYHDFRPETDKLRPICGRKVRSVQNSSPNFFYRKRTKIDDFISKKHTPPLPIWWNRGGGGNFTSC